MQKPCTYIHFNFVYTSTWGRSWNLVGGVNDPAWFHFCQLRKFLEITHFRIQHTVLSIGEGDTYIREATWLQELQIRQLSWSSKDNFGYCLVFYYSWRGCTLVAVEGGRVLTYSHQPAKTRLPPWSSRFKDAREYNFIPLEGGTKEHFCKKKVVAFRLEGWCMVRQSICQSPRSSKFPKTSSLWKTTAPISKSFHPILIESTSQKSNFLKFK